MAETPESPFGGGTPFFPGKALRIRHPKPKAPRGPRPLSPERQELSNVGIPSRSAAQEFIYQPAEAGQFPAPKSYGGQNQFADTLAKWAAKVDRTGTMLTVALAGELYYGCVVRSPVLTAQYRESWRLGVGAPDPSAEARRDKTIPSRFHVGDPPSQEQTRYARQLLRTVKFGDRVFISNQTDYGDKLNLTGYSPQAPAGITDPTLADVRSRFNQILDLVKKAGGGSGNVVVLESTGTGL